MPTILVGTKRAVGMGHPTIATVANGTFEMTESVARILLAILMLPISAGLKIFTMSVVTFSSPQQSELAGVIAMLGEFIFVATYWLLLWRSTVQWTPSRIRKTWLVVALALVFGAIGFGFLTAIATAPATYAAVIAGYSVPILWMLGTVFVWRETPEERLERLKSYGTDTVCCPTCGYNMTGLHEARCPECGVQFTVDELFTAQHDREQELQQS